MHNLTLNTTSEIVALTPMEIVEKEQLEFEQTDCPVKHIFGPGIYVREMSIPAGNWVLGHEHRTDTLNTMTKGKLQIIMGDGTVTELNAPITFTSPPGRKAVYTLEDSVWQNYYATGLTDVAEIEAKFLIQTNFCLERDKAIADNNRDSMEKHRADYSRLLDELEMNEQQIRSLVEDMRDHIDLPYGEYKFQLGDSPIEGKGIFATSDIKQDELIGPANIGGKRTILGRRMNHAIPPNAMMVRVGDNINLYAIRDIKGNNGCDVGEEITVDYRFTLLSLGTNLKELLICQPE